MVNFDIMAALTNTSPAMAFGILAFWFNRRDHADMLRREQAFSAQMAALLERHMTTSEKIAVALERLERQIHDLKNVIQRAMPEIDTRWRDARDRAGDER